MSLTGRLEDLSISDIFHILSVGRKSGRLIVRCSGGTAIVIFKNGMVVRAEMDKLEGTLGDNLFEAGLIKDTVLNLAYEVKQKLSGKSVADVLFEFGSVTREAIDRIAKMRIEEVICRLLMWEEGDFNFKMDDLDIEGKTGLDDLGWELSRGLSPEYLLMEASRVHDESSRFSFVSVQDILGEETVEGGWEEEMENAVTVRKDISQLKTLTPELRGPNSDSEITLLILRFASNIFQRGVLFMVGRNKIVGLGQFGHDIEGADGKVRETVFETDKSPFLKRIVSKHIPFKGPIERDEVTRRIVDELGGEWPSEVAIFPIVAEGRAAAFLYCDNYSIGTSATETEGLEIFISQAGLALEKTLLQRRLQEMEAAKALDEAE